VNVRRIAVGGQELSVAEAGPGLRPVLLVHGFTGAKEDFTEWLDPLAEQGWWAVAPDLRGHGDSSKPAEESAYSSALLAADVIGLADALGWDRFALLGHSMGGMVAQEIAFTASERLTGLILMDTHHGAIEGIDHDDAELAVAVVRTEGIDVLGQFLLTREAPLATAADLRVRAERPGYIEFGERKFLATSPALYAAMVTELFGRPDRLADLARLTLPVLVIVGEQDTHFLGAARRMVAAIPGAELAVIPDAGHSPQFENPAVWGKVVSAFLASLPR
jgi:pimeloyl-ACP methyl ester carboxylesterase